MLVNWPSTNHKDHRFCKARNCIWNKQVKMWPDTQKNTGFLLLREVPEG